MEKLEVINGPATIMPGMVLQLSARQAEARLHLLKSLSKNWYEVQEVTYFKTGEVITFRELPDKSLLPAFFTPEQMANSKPRRSQKMTPMEEAS
jgi:hypothetical protein